MKIITAQERLAQVRAPKILLAGPYGIGKTTQLTTLDPATTLFADLESGDLAVQDYPCDQIRLESWKDCRNLACFLAGPDRNVAPDALYGEQHYESVAKVFREHAAHIDPAKYRTYFIDSITVAGRWCLQWCEQQPEAFTAQGKKDTRGMYGMLGRELVQWLTRLQHARDVAVVLCCILEQHTDDVGRKTWELQIDGSKAGRELPGIVDQVITMQLVQAEGDDAPRRWFVCKPENPKGYPAKDRSGRLDMLEPANLGQLITKLTARNAPLSRAA